jgi:hypothetical protein
MKESFVNVAGDFNVLDTKEEAWGPLPESNTIQLEVNVPSSQPLSLTPQVQVNFSVCSGAYLRS